MAVSLLFLQDFYPVVLPFTCLLCKQIEYQILYEHAHKESYWKFIHIALSVSKTTEVVVEMESHSSYPGVFSDRTKSSESISSTANPMSKNDEDQTSNDHVHEIDQ